MPEPPARRGRGVYRLLLRVYPPEFRGRNEEEMVRLFAEKGRDARAAGLPAVLVHWATGVVDVVRNGLGARRDARAREREAGTPMASARRKNLRSGGGGGMDSIMKDVRYALRTLFKNPGFTIVAVVTIALGIGANTAIFSVVRAVLLAPLPYEDPQELVLLWGEMRTRDVMHFPTSPPDFVSLRDGADALDDLAAVFTFPVSLTGDGDPIQVNAASVTTNFFDVLGVDPVLGRSFIDEDGTPQPQGANPGQPGSLPGIVILSHGLWQQRFGGDPGVVGRTIEIGGGPSEIVGVMPPGFELHMPPSAQLQTDADLWISARIDFVNAPANNVFLRPIGRLADGATIEQLQAQIDRVAASLAAENQTKATAGYAVRVESLHEDVTAHVRPVLLALFGAVVFVLLIACANVSNLMLVRASARDRELAVRAAMGGSRSRIVRQMLMESLLIALMGAVVGIALAAGGVSLLLGLQPDDLPRMASVGIDGVVLLFTVVSAVGAALLFGAIPALQGSRVDLAHVLKERGTAGSSGARRLLRNGVVIGEVALSIVLLIGAGLMVRSFVALANQTPGFEPEGVVTFNATPPFGAYPQPVDRANFYIELQRRLEAMPGVERASATVGLPLQPGVLAGRYGPEEALTDPEAFRQATYRPVLPGYFETMSTRLLAGRTFTDADNADSTAVAVVDEKLAENLWPNRSPVGERFLIRATTPDPQWVEVIGVVEHQRDQDLAVDGMETVYLTDRYIGSFGGTWVVRVTGDPLSIVGQLREEVGQVDPRVPVADVELMSTYVDDAMGPTRFALTLIGVFGVVALLLASVGLYGVLSYVVRQRQAEIGVRMAFGAESSRILRLVVGQGLGLAVAGIVVGLLAALALTGFLDSMLVEVPANDPVTFGGIGVIFLAVAALACYLPARRASFVDPVTALRDE